LQQAAINRLKFFRACIISSCIFSSFERFCGIGRLVGQSTTKWINLNILFFFGMLNKIKISKVYQWMDVQIVKTLYIDHLISLLLVFANKKKKLNDHLKLT
jgi:hypothetical protein